MEAIEFQKKANNASLVPLYGTEYFYLGMPLEELNQILWDYYAIHGEQSSEGFCLFYHITLKRSIRISIDVLTQSVFSIAFLQDYKGTYEGIGLGSSVQELLAIRSDVSFDEEYLMVGAYPYDFVLKINNQDHIIYSLDEVMQHKITQIVVENKALLDRK